MQAFLGSHWVASGLLVNMLWYRVVCLMTLEYGNLRSLYSLYCLTQMPKLYPIAAYQFSLT
jgi:hypothetical protein